MNNKISMQHIADELGISKYSVSQALSGKIGVSLATRKAVVETARLLGYQTKQTGESSQQNNAPSAVGQAFVLICMHPTRSKDPDFNERVLQGMQSACNTYGWEQLVFYLPSKSDAPIELPAYIDLSACVGVVMLGEVPLMFIHSVLSRQLPVVLVDHHEPMVEIDCVVNANMDAARLLMKRQFAHGHRRYIFVGYDAYAVSFRERWWGCRMGMEENQGKQLDAELKKWNVPYENKERWTELVEARLSALGEEELPNCFIGANDDIAIQLIQMLKKQGRTIPTDCAVVGFDNITHAAFTEPPLTTVELGKERLGDRAIRLLHHRIHHPDTAHEKITLSPRLITRSSG